MSEIAISNLEAESRGHRAMALMCASVSLRGEFDAERLLGLADEFYQYITGDDGAALPRPDKASKGKMPDPKRPYGR